MTWDIVEVASPQNNPEKWTLKDRALRGHLNGISSEAWLSSHLASIQTTMRMEYFAVERAMPKLGTYK
jgi:hypothetical protein